MSTPHGPSYFKCQHYNWWKNHKNSKKKNFSKFMNNDREQFIGCFKCGKHDHIVKNCSLLKKEQEPEQFQEQGRKQAENSFANRSANSFAKRFSKAILATWGDSTEDDKASEEKEVVVALMARSESDSDDESLDSLAQLKEKVHVFNKAQLKGLIFTLMDEYDSVNSENCMLKDACSELKRDVRELEHENKILKSEKIECVMRTLVLQDDLAKFKETLSLKEEVFATELNKLEK